MPDDVRVNEFKRILTLFIRDYKLPIKARDKFNDSSPTVYEPTKQ